MERKRDLHSVDRYGSDFPKRLRQLMEEQHKTQQDVADFLGKSRQAVGFYASGASSPDWETIAQLARFFHVSSDWLLGVTNTRSDELASMTVGNLGLSDHAIKQILDIQNVESLLENDCSVRMIDLLNMVLENSCFEPLLEDLQLCLDYIFKLSQNKVLISDPERQLIEEAVSDLRAKTNIDFAILPDYQLPDYYRSQVENFAGQLIASIIGNYRHSLQNTIKKPAAGGENSGIL